MSDLPSKPAERVADSGPGRRRFLRGLTVALGAAMSAAVGIPILRYLVFPVGKRVVSQADAPIDVLAENEVPADGTPVKVQLKGQAVRNAWATADAVVLGSAWVRRGQGGAIVAFSSVCPHLGCAVDYRAEERRFECPCHKSAFSLDGEKSEGSPAKRGLDPLPVAVEDGRVKVRFVRYRQDVAEREPV